MREYEEGYGNKLKHSFTNYKKYWGSVFYGMDQESSIKETLFYNEIKKYSFKIFNKIDTSENIKFLLALLN